MTMNKCLPSSVVRKPRVVVTEADHIANILAVVAQDIVNLTEGVVLVTVRVNTSLGSQEGDKRSICCENMMSF